MNQETVNSMALTFVKDISRRVAQELYRHVGCATDIMDHAAEVGNSKLATALAENRDVALKRAEEEARFCEDHRIRCLTPADPDYPDRLRNSHDAPLVIYYRGTASLQSLHMVSIVGTRRCTEYGKDLCHRITADLGRLCPDTVVVSGLAYGIDIHAHRGALEAGLSTIAVLAHGMDQIYPNSHRNDAQRMLAQGGLLSEYPSGTKPLAPLFLERNRIIAALSDATIVVESARKGGAVVTAGLAFDCDRQVYACPGRLGDEHSEGCNRLIRQQKAVLFSSAEDMLDDLKWLSETRRKTLNRQGVQTELFPNLTDEERAVVDILGESEGMQVNELAMRLGQPVQQLSALLFEMEMKGYVAPVAGGVYRLRR